MTAEKAGFRNDLKEFVCRECHDGFETLNNYEKSRWMTKIYLEQVLRKMNPGMVPEDKDDLNDCFVDGKGDVGVDFFYRNDGHRIKLNKNKWSAKEDSFTLVDIDDLEKLKPYTIHKVGGGYAAIAFENRTLPLHRFIMGLTNSPRSAGEVDHINENKLDNRKKNLEIISHRENIRRANKKREKIYR